MKKNTLKLGIITTALLGLIACGTKTTNEAGAETTNPQTIAQETELKSFMVGGMYFMHGFGGVSTVENMAEQNGTAKEELVNSYREIFILPFKTEQASDIKTTLKEWWDIDSKESLVATLEELKTKTDPKNPHKAWDFARIINNACMGYAAGYLTADEAKKHVAEVLPLAQKQFKTWADFFIDYNEGLKTWDPKDPNLEDMKKVTTDMLVSPKGIYQLLPLN